MEKSKGEENKEGGKRGKKEVGVKRQKSKKKGENKEGRKEKE